MSFLFLERERTKEKQQARCLTAMKFIPAMADDGSDYVSRDAPPVLYRGQYGGQVVRSVAGIFNKKSFPKQSARLFAVGRTE